MIFGKNKRDKEPTPYEIGKNGTVEEFRQANKTAQNRKEGDSYYIGADDQRELQRGAIQGFREGRAGNLCALLLDPSAFEIILRYGSKESVASEKILSDLLAGSNNPSAIISLMIDKVPEQRKQEFLDDVLIKVVSSCVGAESFIAALVNLGANANAAEGDYAGVVLGKAVIAHQTLPVVKFLYENGAGFDDTLFLMRIRGWNEGHINSLKAYRELVTGEASTEEAKTQQTLGLLLEVVAELTGKVTDLTEEVQSLKAGAFNRNKPKKQQESGLEKKPYLSLKGSSRPKKTVTTPTP